jgi:hypothetical protein
MIHRSPAQITIQTCDFHIVDIVTVRIVDAFKCPLVAIPGIFVEKQRLFFTIKTRHLAPRHQGDHVIKPDKLGIVVDTFLHILGLVPGNLGAHLAA